MRYQFPGSAVALFAACALTASASAQYADNFDSYTSGSQLEGQGGWQNWGGCNMANTAFSTVSSAQAFSGANAMSIVGGADTTNSLGGPYTAGFFTFSIQTYVPTGLTGTQYVILLSEFDPCLASGYRWAAQIGINGATGMVASDDWVGTLVIGSGNGDQAIIYDQWVELKIEIDVTNDTQVSYYNGVQMWEGVWNSDDTGVLSIEAIDLYPAGAGVEEVFYDDVSLIGGIPSGPIGTNYCMANANGSGVPSVISADGTIAVLDNDVTLTVANVLPQTFAFFVNSQTQGFVTNPGGSFGNLCLGGAVGRHQQAIFNTGATGSGSIVLDLNAIPSPAAPGGLTSVLPGETWNFQCWHRDVIGGTVHSNFSDGISITFQ